jgi:hypothetical protein
VVKVFPSAGFALLITRERSPFVAIKRTSFVRSDR